MSDPLIESGSLTSLTLRATGQLSAAPWASKWQLVGMLTPNYKKFIPGPISEDWDRAGDSELFLTSHDGAHGITTFPEKAHFRSVLHSLAGHPKVNWIPALTLYVEHPVFPVGVTPLPGLRPRDYPNAQKCTTVITVSYNGTLVILSGLESKGLEPTAFMTLDPFLQVCVGYLQLSFHLPTAPTLITASSYTGTLWGMSVRNMCQTAIEMGSRVTWDQVLDSDPAKANEQLGTSLLGIDLEWEFIRKQAANRNNNPFVSSKEAKFLDTNTFARHLQVSLPSLESILFEMDILGHKDLSLKFANLLKDRNWA